MSFQKGFILGILLIFWLNTPAASYIAVPDGWEEQDPFVETAPEPTPREVDLLSGFVPYTRNYMGPIFANSRPLQGEVTDTFSVTLARGEYEPFIICLYALRDKPNIHVEIKEVKSQDGEILPIQFEIRRIGYRAVLPKDEAKSTKFVDRILSFLKSTSRNNDKRYKLIPSLLRLTSSADLKKGRTSAFWITVHVFKECAPGNYCGRVVISKNGNQLRSLRIEARVLPFVLEDVPDRVFSILYTPVDPSNAVEENVRLLLKDMKAHGITSYSPLASAWGNPLQFNKQGIPQVDNFLHHLQWADEEGIRGPTLLNVEKLVRAARPDLHANYSMFEEHIDIPNLKRLVDFLERERKRNNWPEVVYLPIDEPGAYTDQVGTRREEMAVLLLKTLNDLNVRCATTVGDLVDNKHRKLPRWKHVVGWWEKMRLYCDVRIYQNGYPEGKTCLANEIKDAVLRGHEVMLYERTSTHGIDPAVSRMYFGFYGWKTSVAGITAWPHPTLWGATLHNTWADPQEKTRKMQAYFRDPNWQLPPSIVCWEMVREGIDDAKYLYIFQQTLKQHGAVNPKYFKLIDELKTAIDATGMSSKEISCGWDGRRFSHFRERIIQAILEI